MMSMGQTKQRETVVQSKRMVFGLLKARIGSDHMIRTGKSLAQFRVQDIRRHSKAKAIAWICLHPECRGTKFASEAELVEAHDSAEDLVKRNEKHVFAAWSDDPVVLKPATKDKDGKSVAEVTHPLGLLSDTE